MTQMGIDLFFRDTKPFGKILGAVVLIGQECHDLLPDGGHRISSVV